MHGAEQNRGCVRPPVAEGHEGGGAERRTEDDESGEAMDVELEYPPHVRRHDVSGVVEIDPEGIKGRLHHRGAWSVTTGVVRMAVRTGLLCATAQGTGRLLPLYTYLIPRPDLVLVLFEVLD